MNPHLPYIIPFTGLKEGLHQFDFQADKGFFGAITDSLISSGTVTAHLDFDKQPTMMVLSFRFEGKIATSCDRCCEPITQKIKGSSRYIVKMAETESEDDEIVYISFGKTSLNVAHFLYESIVLELPLRNVHANNGCNPEILAKITGALDFAPQSDEKDEDEPTKNTDNPFKKGLEGFDFTKN